MQPRVERIAVIDGAGNRKDVFKVTPFKNVGTARAPEWMDTLPSYRQANGRGLNRDGEDFIVPETGERLRIATVDSSVARKP